MYMELSLLTLLRHPLHQHLGFRVGLCKIFFQFFLCVQESIIPLLPPPIRITHTTAILRDFCAIHIPPPILPVYVIHYNIGNDNVV